MPRQTRAELFIETLTEIRDEDHSNRRECLRLEVKDHVRRFLDRFRPDSDNDREPLR